MSHHYIEEPPRGIPAIPTSAARELDQARAEAQAIAAKEHMRQQQEALIVVERHEQLARRSGWICPRCDAVLAPHISMCERCSPRIEQQ